MGPLRARNGAAGSVRVMKFDDEGPWELEVSGFEVLLLTFGVAGGVEIVAYGPEGVSSKIRLGAFELLRPGGETESFDTNSWVHLAALCVIQKDRIRLARITKTCELRVDFESGLTITANSDGPFENWEMHAPGGVIAIGTPGEGPPAIWDGDPNRTVTYSDGRYFDSGGKEVPEPDYLKEFLGRSETET
jgi:hypothetical protein